jgi:hypothetical protein
LLIMAFTEQPQSSGPIPEGVGIRLVYGLMPDEECSGAAGGTPWIVASRVRTRPWDEEYTRWVPRCQFPYAVVEKVGTPGTEATRLDPRTNGDA